MTADDQDHRAGAPMPMSLEEPNIVLEFAGYSTNVFSATADHGFHLGVRDNNNAR